MMPTEKEPMFREALLRIVRSCRRAKTLSEIFSREFSRGSTNCFDDLYGDLEDALYLLNDEKTDELQQSLVDQILWSSLTDEEATDTLSRVILGKDEAIQENLVLRW